MSRRSGSWFAVVTALALTLSACGGDDDGGGEETSLAEIESCVEEAGLATEHIPLSTNDGKIGVVGQMSVARPVGTPGLGRATVAEFETDADAAGVAEAGIEASGRFVIYIYEGPKVTRPDTAAVTEAVRACVPHDDEGEEESAAPEESADEICLENAGYVVEPADVTPQPDIGLVNGISVTVPSETPGFGHAVVLEYETEADAAAGVTTGQEETSGRFVISSSKPNSSDDRAAQTAVTEAVRACLP